MSVCLSVCLYVSLPVCLSVSLYVFLSVCLSALISTISHQQANMQWDVRLSSIQYPIFWNAEKLRLQVEGNISKIEKLTG